MNNKIYSIFKVFAKWALFYLDVRSGFKEFMFIPVSKRCLCECDIEKMKICCGLVEKITNVTYRLTDGTALGLYRDGGFIKHDDDVDIDILDITKEQLLLLKKMFKGINMHIGRYVFYKNKVQQLVFYDNDGFVFDIVFWTSSGDKVYNYCERGYERIQHAKFFNPSSLGKIEFSGTLFPMPSLLDEWVIMRYGNDWHVPKTYKGDWKDECYDMQRMV